MTELERLMKLLEDKQCPAEFLTHGDLRVTAEWLLANGVIVPPCKVGSKIYMLVTKRSKVHLPPFTFIKVSRMTFYNLERVLQDFGKTVFLTREEAEKALKEGSRE